MLKKAEGVGDEDYEDYDDANFRYLAIAELEKELMDVEEGQNVGFIDRLK